MIRSRVRGVRQLRAVLFSTLAVATTATAQQRDASEARAWVDRYYADYTAMSAAPTGPAMDRWLSHYAPYVVFEDPTAGLSAIGHDRIRAPYIEAFTGPLGPVRWTILRFVSRGDWTAVEGWVDGTLKGKPIRARFTTWLKIRDAKIVHQIDYVDYAAFRGQVAARDIVPEDQRRDRGSLPAARADAARALRVADEFYRRYESLPTVGSPAGLTHFVDLLTEDFILEDPTAPLSAESREKMRALLNTALVTGDYGPIHWDIDRAMSDGEWVAVEGTWRGMYKRRPFATRFSTWLQVRGDSIARQIDYFDYVTFRRLTSPPKTP